MARNEKLFNAIIEGKKDTAVAAVREAVDAKQNIEEVLEGSMIPAMKEIGDRFSRNEAFVPEMLMAARAMQAGLALIEPILNASGHQPLGRVCIGTVKGDLHDIGKNLVAIMLKGAGYDVTDLGVDCDAESYYKAVREGAQAVLLSSLLTTTMSYMKTVVEKLAEFPNVKVIIGGAPVTKEYADSIGAHGYAADAGGAVSVVSACLGLA
ncbi:MAG: cobalamin-binding protein [Spirochaetes bacterium]|nr:MAG: cobalamin-binding protein [Spirochaetota bacterium]